MAPAADGRRQIEASGDPHEPYAQGSGNGPGTADTDCDDGADERARGVENARIEYLNAIVDHGRYGA